MRTERAEEEVDVVGTVIVEVEDCEQFIVCCKVVLEDGEESACMAQVNRKNMSASPLNRTASIKLWCHL